MYSLLCKHSRKKNKNDKRWKLYIIPYNIMIIYNTVMLHCLGFTYKKYIYYTIDCCVNDTPLIKKLDTKTKKH